MFFVAKGYTLSMYHIFSLGARKEGEETAEQRNDKPYPTCIIYSKPVLSLKVRRQSLIIIWKIFIWRVLSFLIKGQII